MNLTPKDSLSAKNAAAAAISSTRSIVTTINKSAQGKGASLSWDVFALAMARI
jgi:hypothetical protein